MAGVLGGRVPEEGVGKFVSRTKSDPLEATFVFGHNKEGELPIDASI